MPRYSPAAVNHALDMRQLAERYGAEFRVVRQSILWANCPFPFHNERTPSFTVRPHTNHFYCYGCGKGGDPLRFIQIAEGLTAQTDFPKALEIGAQLGGVAADLDDRERERIEKLVAAKQERHRAEMEAEKRAKAMSARKRWFEAEPSFRGTVAETYLRDRRGLNLDRLGPLSAIRYTDGFRWNMGAPDRPEWIARPAMLTALTRGSKITGVHCTVLKADGSDCQRDVAQKGRIVFGSVAGAAMRLYRGASGRDFRTALKGYEQDGEVETIALAEGLEDTLSVAMLMPDWRCWAAYSLNNIGRVEMPAFCGELVLCGENDASAGARQALGRAAKEQVQRSQGRYLVRGARPPDGKKDWNAVFEREAL